MPHQHVTPHTDTLPPIAPGELDAQHHASIRAWDALMLATTPQAWAALLQGKEVPIDQLDPEHLARRRRRRAA